jgi:hypothetical protein
MSEKTYSYSTDEERYHDEFGSIEEACAEASAGRKEGFRFWVGEIVPPMQPESWWRADDWLEHVSDQDEYNGEHAEGWNCSTSTQRTELEMAVRTVMADWLDRHDLRPKFWNIENVREYVVTGEGKWEPATVQP